jgi:hypothetical protein
MENHRKTKFSKFLSDNYTPKDTQVFKKRTQKSTNKTNNDLSRIFQKIPLDTHDLIISFLPFQEIFQNITKVCKFWNKITKSKSHFHTQTSLLFSHFPSDKILEEILPNFENIKEISIKNVHNFPIQKLNLKSLTYFHLNNSTCELEYKINWMEILSTCKYLKVLEFENISKDFWIQKHSFQNVKLLKISKCKIFNWGQVVSCFNSNLKELVLCGSNGIPFILFSELTSKGIKLTSLKISGFSFVESSFLEYVKTSNSLKELHLNDMDNKLITEKFFHSFPKLEKLSVKDNSSFSDQNFILENIGSLKSLKELDFTGDYTFMNENFMHCIRRRVPTLMMFTTKEGKFEIKSKKFFKVQY